MSRVALLLAHEEAVRAWRFARLVRAAAWDVWQEAVTNERTFRETGCGLDRFERLREFDRAERVARAAYVLATRRYTAADRALTKSSRDVLEAP